MRHCQQGCGHVDVPWLPGSQRQCPEARALTAFPRLRIKHSAEKLALLLVHLLLLPCLGLLVLRPSSTPSTAAAAEVEAGGQAAARCLATTAAAATAAAQLAHACGTDGCEIRVVHAVDVLRVWRW